MPHDIISSNSEYFGFPYVIQFYFDFMNDNPWEIGINLIFTLLLPLQDVLLPHLYGNIITSLEKKGDFFKPFMTVLVAIILIQIGFYIEDWHDSHLYPKLQEYLRSKMLSSIIRKYETSYKELNVGELLSVLVKVPLTMTIWFERIKNVILPFFLVFIIASIYFMFVDVILGASLLLLGILFTITLFFAPKKCSNITERRDNALNAIYEEVDDMLRNLFSIYGCDQYEAEMQRTQKYENIHQDLFQKTVSCIFKYKFFVTPITISFLCIFFFRCWHLISDGKMDSGKFVPVFIIVLYLLSSITYTGDQFRDIVFEWGVIKSADAIVKPIDTPQETSILYDEHLPTSGIGMMNVSFKYENTKHATLSNFNIHINDGERVVLMGDIGSGKSTVLKLFLKYYEPSHGTVYLNGWPFNAIKVKSLRKRIGYVPQVPVLFNRSVIENIAYGTDKSRSQIVDFLQQHDILREFKNLSDGLDTKIGKNGSILSGGQRQMIWCIRVILTNPEIIILDEPTSSVDLKTKNLLLKLLDVSMQGKTVIMVSHDEYLISRASRQIRLHQGEIVSDTYIPNDPTKKF